jgi:hypothetical protein
MCSAIASRMHVVPGVARHDTLRLQRVFMKVGKLGRNAPCWCGSRKKYKKCHLEADLAARDERNAQRISHAREIFQIRESIVAPKQIRSDEIGPFPRETV